MTHTLGDQKAKELGSEAADAAEREGRRHGRGQGHSALGRGRKVGPAKATVRGQNRRRERRESPRMARPGHKDHLRLRKMRCVPTKLGPSLNA